MYREMKSRMGALNKKHKEVQCAKKRQWMLTSTFCLDVTKTDWKRGEKEIKGAEKGWKRGYEDSCEERNVSDESGKREKEIERWEHERGRWRLFTRVTGCGTDDPVVHGSYGFMVWPFACCIAGCLKRLWYTDNAPRHELHGPPIGNRPV